MSLCNCFVALKIKKLLFLIFTLLVFVVLASFLSGVYASEYLEDPMFTSGETYWNLHNAIFDSGYYKDMADSLRIETEVGRGNELEGWAQQETAKEINSNDLVDLSFNWSKECIEAQCHTHEMRVEIADSSDPENFDVIWVNYDTPDPGQTYGWFDEDIDISGNIDESSKYIVRVYADLRNRTGGLGDLSQSIAWFDNVEMFVETSHAQVNSFGKQRLVLPVGTENNYLGGGFTFVTNFGSGQVEQINLSNVGSVNYDDLGGVLLYYKEEEDCSESIPDDAQEFNSEKANFGDDDVAEVQGSMNVDDAQVCVYVEIDIEDPALDKETLDLEISSPQEDIIVQDVEVFNTSAIELDNVTVLREYAGENNLSNSNFDNDAENWTLSNFQYQEEWYQSSPGGVHASPGTGQNNELSGYIGQTISEEIGGNDMVELGLAWSKECIELDCRDNEIFVEIANTSDPNNFTEIWRDDSVPDAGDERTWNIEENIDVGEYFEDDANYIIRVNTYLRNGRDHEANSNLWVDDVRLQVFEDAQGFLVSDFVDENMNTVDFPNISLSPGSFSVSQKTENFNIFDQDYSISVSNTTDNSNWALSLSVLSDAWEHSSEEYSYKYDGTEDTGRLLVDPQGNCSNTGIDISNPEYFKDGEVSEITLVSADENADIDCSWLIKNLNFEQDIPHKQPVGKYSISFVFTII